MREIPEGSVKKTSFVLGRLNSPRELTEAGAAYWAAMVDGEGSILIARAQPARQVRPQFRLVVNVTNTDFALLDALASMIGVGTLQRARRDHERWKDRGQLILNHEAADFVIRQIRPYLVAKCAQADNAMRFMDLKRAWSRANDNWREQEAIYLANRELNGRGKAHQKAYEFESAEASQRSCEYAACNQKHYGNGFCRQHYRWVFESKTWTEGTSRACGHCAESLAPNLKVSAKFCSTACKMKFHRRQGCYTAEALADAPKCNVEGCDRPQQAKGLCRRHYMRQWHAQKAT